MRNFRVFNFPLILAMLGVMLAGCAGVETGRDVARGPAQTAAGETVATGMPANGELPGLAPAGETSPAEHPAALAILRMAQESKTVLSDPSVSADERAENFRRLMARDVDIPPIARMCRRGVGGRAIAQRS